MQQVRACAACERRVRFPDPRLAACRCVSYRAWDSGRDFRPRSRWHHPHNQRGQRPRPASHRRRQNRTNRYWCVSPSNLKSCHLQGSIYLQAKTWFQSWNFRQFFRLKLLACRHPSPKHDRASVKIVGNCRPKTYVRFWKCPEIMLWKNARKLCPEKLPQIMTWKRGQIYWPVFSGHWNVQLTKVLAWN